MTAYTQIKARLLEKQKQLHDRLESTLEAERTEVEPDLDDAAQAWEESEVRGALGDEAAVELDQVNEALERLENGEYGRCRSCGKEIRLARLEALPYATTCIECAERAE